MSSSKQVHAANSPAPVESARADSGIGERRVAIITGGAQGIGGAVASELARRGAHIIINLTI